MTFAPKIFARIALVIALVQPVEAVQLRAPTSATLNVAKSGPPVTFGPSQQATWIVAS